MAKDRIDRAELADKLVEEVKEAQDPIRAMAQLMADFLMESEVTAKVAPLTVSGASLEAVSMRRARR